MIPRPAFRYYSLLHSEQAAAAKVLYKMHTTHPAYRSSYYASVTSYSTLLQALASGCLLHWTATATSADSQIAMEISVVKEFKGPGTVHVSMPSPDKMEYKLFRRKGAQISLKQ